MNRNVIVMFNNLDSGVQEEYDRITIDDNYTPNDYIIDLFANYNGDLDTQAAIDKFKDECEVYFLNDESEDD